MVQSNKNLFKNNPTDIISWVDNSEDVKGEFVFTFDGIEFFNLFSDYPNKLTKAQKRTFDAENPYWAEFFKDRIE